MRVRFFGEPWPSADERAPICDDDAYRVDVPVGRTCAGCEQPIGSDDQGVVMAASSDMDVAWLAEVPSQHVCAWHLECELLAVMGPDVLELVKRQDDRYQHLKERP